MPVVDNLTKSNLQMANLYEGMQITFDLDKVTVSLTQKMIVMTFLSQSLSSYLLVEVLQLNFVNRRGIEGLQSVFRLEEEGM